MSSSYHAEIILRTSDKVEYRVRRLYLRAGSVVFDDMLSNDGIGTIGEESVDGLKIVDVSETDAELKLLLSVLLPGKNRQDNLTMTSIERFVWLPCLSFCHVNS